MIYLRWLVAVPLLLVFFWIASLNAIVFVNGFIRKQKTPSWIPLLAGVAGLLGLIAIPVGEAWRLCWLPLLLDWGSVPGIGYTLVFYAVRWMRGGNSA
jgi:hypothetical protein